MVRLHQAMHRALLAVGLTFLSLAPAMVMFMAEASIPPASLTQQLHMPDPKEQSVYVLLHWAMSKLVGTGKIQLAAC